MKTGLKSKDDLMAKKAKLLCEILDYDNVISQKNALTSNGWITGTLKIQKKIGQFGRTCRIGTKVDRVV